MNNPNLTSLLTRPQRRSAAYTGQQAQRGVVLFMVLMVTLVIVALSVSLATGVFSEQKISRNAADIAIARQAAEAALRDAEQDLRCKKWDTVSQTFINVTASNAGSTGTGGDGSSGAAARLHCKASVNAVVESTGTAVGSTDAGVACSQGLVAKVESTSDTMPNPADITSCNSAYGTFTSQAPLLLVNKPPIYMIERFTAPQHDSRQSTIVVYRIVARGYGRDPNTTVDLESLYRLADHKY